MIPKEILDTPLILGADGQAVQSKKYEPCPRCKRAYTERVPSGGFGTGNYMLCICGYDFNKEIPCQSPLV
jgi:hypothetical protein